MTHETFRDAVVGHFIPRESAQLALTRYFVTEPFTGRHFETFADDERPDVITERDLLAVEMLGVQVPAAVAIWMLGEGRRAITELLVQIPCDVDIWDAPAALQPGSPADGLWTLLGHGRWPTHRDRNGLGRTTRSKLLAAKRPRLLPVLDSVVCNALPPAQNHWLAFVDTLRDETARSVIEDATAVKGVPAGVSLLRRLDVVVWMAHTKPQAESSVDAGDTDE